MSSARATVGSTPTRTPAVQAASGRPPHRVEPSDIVSIYAERLRDNARATTPPTARTVVRIGRGTPAFRRQRRTARTSTRGMLAPSPRRSSRRTRLVAAAAAVAAVVTTALASTVLAG